jgi:dTDP-glucose 4,6-dehydratase
MSDYREIKRAAVTGASGYIGSHLTEELVGRGIEVVALVHSNSNNHIGNLRELPKETLERVTIRFSDILAPSDLKAAFHSVDTVFHLAAQISVPYSNRAPMLFVQTNVVGTYNVLDTAKTLGIPRVVVVSSSEVYGGTSKEAFRETTPLCARSPYAASKIAAEKMAEAFYHCYRLGTVMIRPFNTFGPRQSLRAVIPWIVKQALEKDEIILGNLKPERDFVYVTDTVSGMIAAASAKDVEGRTYNLSTGAAVSVGEIVRIVGKKLGKELRVKHVDEQTRDPNSEVWTLVGDSTAAREQLGWKPVVKFEEGLDYVIESIKKHLVTGIDPSIRYE